MDPIIGEFTVTSGSDPAIFHTTFARAVNLDEGYEIALKSIYHGPVKNLVYNKFKLHNEDTTQELELAPRFYSAPSDILLDMHQAIANVCVPTLFEKDGQMKMVMPDDFWIEVNEAMFLNQNFKYVTNRKRAKRAVRKYKPPKEPIDRIREKITTIEEYLYGKDPKVGLVDGFEIVVRKMNDLEGKLTYITNMGEWKQSEEVKKQFVEVVGSIRDLSDKFDALSYDDNFQDKVESISSDILAINTMIQELESSIAANKDSITTLEGQVVFLTNAFNKTSYTLEKLDESMLREEQPDKDHKYSIDTSQMASRRKQMLHVTSISVSMKPVEKTLLAFLYASPVENSLINNQESRMLTPIPVTSKQCYNYVEFAQPLYRKISVRQFMDISFEILDKNGKQVEFNLYGDDLDQENREYPTILNLHIRRAI